jgi:LacI family transcriptional regulator
MVKSRRVTLSDVAVRAGVSRTTASYTLNGLSARMRITPETEERVRRAVDDLGYRPNHTARSLRTSTTRTIGVITDFVASGMFASRMLAGANAAARARDHLLVMGETEGDPAVAALLIDDMTERQVDGILYITRTTLRTRLPTGMPAGRSVMLNCVDPSGAVPSVLPDERLGGRTAARALLDVGLREGVHLVGLDPTPDALAGPLRLAGVQDAFAEEGAALGGTVPCEWTVQGGYAAVRAWLAEGHRPQALICLNDRIAMGVYQALAEHRLAVPENVSVVSFDGSDLATWLRPQVASVELPFAEMGRRAVELLLGPARSHRGRPVLVPMPLLSGASVASRRAVPLA